MKTPEEQEADLKRAKQVQQIRETFGELLEAEPKIAKDFLNLMNRTAELAKDRQKPLAVDFRRTRNRMLQIPDIEDWNEDTNRALVSTVYGSLREAKPEVAEDLITTFIGKHFANYLFDIEQMVAFVDKIHDTLQKADVPMNLDAADDFYQLYTTGDDLEFRQVPSDEEQTVRLRLVTGDAETADGPPLMEILLRVHPTPYWCRNPDEPTGPRQ